MQVKTAMSYHLTLIRMAIIKKSTNNKCWRGCGERERSYTVGGNVNWYSHYGRWYGESFKNLGKKLPYNPGIPLLGIYSEETKIEKDTCIPLLGIHTEETRRERDTCTPMFITARFIIARTWKQPRQFVSLKQAEKAFWRRNIWIESQKLLRSLLRKGRIQNVPCQQWG